MSNYLKLFIHRESDIGYGECTEKGQVRGVFVSDKTTDNGDYSRWTVS